MFKKRGEWAVKEKSQLTTHYSPVIPQIFISISGVRFPALLDTGSTLSFISSDKLTSNQIILPWDLGSIEMMDGSTCSPLGYSRIKFRLGNKVFTRNFLVLNCANTIVLGMDFMKTSKVILDLDKGKLHFKNNSSLQFPIYFNNEEKLNGENVRIITDIEKLKIGHLLERYHDIIDSPLGRVKGYDHVITLTHENPKRQNPYPTSPVKAAEIDRQVTDMLAQGLIRKSNSPYAAPVILREKPNGEWRFITDFSHINSLTVADSYPMIRIQDILKSLGNANYITTLDAEKGYWQVPMDENSKKYTAFRTRKGLYEYNVLPFGLKNSPATFQRIMNEVLEGFSKFAMVYQDDIIIFSSTFKEHLSHIDRVLERLQRANITLKRSKCSFGVQQVKFLGHIVSASGIAINPEKIKVIDSFERPQTRKQLKKFLGILNFYNHFFEHIGDIAAPLYSLSSTKVKYKWTEKHEIAFTKLKKEMCNAITLNYPNFGIPFILRTDASDYGISGALSQIDENGTERVISFCSKTLGSAQRNYATVEKELFAIVFSLNKFYEYLDGQEFYIETDNQALSYLNTMKNSSQRLMRWAWKIQEFSPHIKYIKGATNIVADYLSRYPVKTEDCDEKEADYMYPPVQGKLALVSTVNLDAVKEAQITDPFCMKITAKLPSPNFQINNDVVFKIFAETSKTVPVIPASLITETLKQFHDHVVGGHLGVSKTYSKMKSRVYYPGLKKIVTDYIRTCDTCQKVNYSHKKPPGQMSSPSVNAPWTTIHMDLMGPYVKSHPGGYKFIFVLIDYFSKWVEIFPSRLATTKNISRILESQIFCRFGIPKTIVTDNGPCFISSSFKSCLKQWGVSHFLIPPYTPQVNLTERANRTIKQILRTFLIDKNHSKWAECLPYVQLAINSSKQESTKFTPSEAFLGRQINLPIDNSLQNTILPYDKELYNQISLLIQQNLETASSIQKQHYDSRHDNEPLQVGDKVLLKDVQLSDQSRGITAGLNPLYQPQVCTIVSKKSDSIFHVQLPCGRTKGPLHISFLRKYNERDDRLFTPDVSISNIAAKPADNPNVNLEIVDPINLDSTNDFQIQNIIDEMTVDLETHISSLPIASPLPLPNPIRPKRQQARVNYRENRKYEKKSTNKK